MILLTDHDIALKLAQLDLLPLLWEPHGLKHSDVMVRANIIQQLEVALGTKKDLALTRLRGAADKFRKLTASDPKANALQAQYAILDRMKRHGGFDAGEAQLFLEASKSKDAIVQTGDKKALKALHWASPQNDEFATLSKELRGRCLCLEQVLVTGLKEETFEKIQKCDLTKIDAGLASKATGKTMDEFRKELATEIQTLRSKTGTLLRT